MKSSNFKQHPSSNHYQFFCQNRLGLNLLVRDVSINDDIIVFPHAGSTTLAYQSFAKQLSHKVNVSAIDYPGHLVTEPHLYTDIPSLVSWILECISPSYFENKVIVGHSMGGYVAYETALQLSRLNINVKGMIISCSSPPHCKRGIYENEYSDNELINKLSRSIGELEEIKRIVEIDINYISMLRNDLKMYEKYIPDEVVNIPTCVIGSNADSVCNMHGLLGWKKWLKNAVVKFLKGSHLYILNLTDENKSIFIHTLTELGVVT